MSHRRLAMTFLLASIIAAPAALPAQAIEQLAQAAVEQGPGGIAWEQRLKRRHARKKAVRRRAKQRAGAGRVDERRAEPIPGESQENRRRAARKERQRRLGEALARRQQERAQRLRAERWRYTAPGAHAPEHPAGEEEGRAPQAQPLARAELPRMAIRHDEPRSRRHNLRRKRHLEVPPRPQLTRGDMERAERLAATLRHQPMETAVQVLVKRKRLSLEHQRAVYRAMGRGAILDALRRSADPIIAQRLAPAFAAVSANQTLGWREVYQSLAAAGVSAEAALSYLVALDTVRHEARTELYQEALAELKRRPKEPMPSAAGSPQATPCAPPETPFPHGTRIASPAVPSAPAAPVLGSARRVPGDEELLEPPIRRKLAVLIGNNTYPPPIPSLDTPQADVAALAEVLHGRLGYDTRVLKDAGKAQILCELARVAREAGPNDSILVYYAGHGYLRDDIGEGYWIPADASPRTAAHWISNADIAVTLRQMQARQIMVVADSCYSGSLTRERPLSSIDKTEDMLLKRSVMVMSSGGEEPVADAGGAGHSVFAQAMLDVLRRLEGGDIGFDAYRNVHDEVVKAAPQTPEYGGIVSAGYVEGADYLLEASTPLSIAPSAKH